MKSMGHQCFNENPKDHFLCRSGLGIADSDSGGNDFPTLLEGVLVCVSSSPEDMFRTRSGFRIVSFFKIPSKVSRITVKEGR